MKTATSSMVATSRKEDPHRHKSREQLIAELRALEAQAEERAKEPVRVPAIPDSAEKVLRESESNLRDILEKSPIGVAIVRHQWRDGRVEAERLFANEALVEMFGGTSTEQMVTSDISGTWADLNQLYMVNERAKNGIDLVDFEAHRRGMDGREIWVSMNARPGRFENQDCMIVWHFDVTERKKAEQALRENETQLRLIIDSLPVLITYLDNDFRFLMVNRTATEWYGRPATEIIGKKPEDFFGPDFETWRSQMADSMRGNASTYERQTTYPDGVTRDVRAIHMPEFDPEGRVKGLFSLVEDITETKKVEERLHQSQRMEAIGQVTGGVAHEFNNLLMAITGNLELLLEGSLTDTADARKVLEQVLQAAFRGKDLTSHMLSYTGNQFNQPEIIDVGASVTFLAKFLRPALGETITIETDIQPDPWPINIDPGEFERALTNLAINARDAMPDGGTITVSAMNTYLDRTFAASGKDVVKPGDYVCVSVTDTGTGMTPEVIEHAFDPFYTTKPVGKGTGLGLSMIYGFVRRQSGGYIDIQSRDGHGTTVAMYLPRAIPGDEPAEPDDGAASVTRTILLVEDDEGVSDMLANLLKSRNYTVLRAADGDAAMALLEPDREIDLLLSDVILPGRTSGVDLAEHARKTRPDMQVILISGYADDELAAKKVPKGRYPLLSKPFLNRDLLRILDEGFG